MKKSNKNETYLILERSNAPLISTKTDKDYILEGQFTTFDILNENQRIYQWKEFEPHLKMLQEKIKRSNGLLGDADHPESPTSAPSLKTAAILIEHLEYDPKNNCVNGRVSVLDTDAGKNIRKLIDRGYKISISSRALGSVRENKTVEIQRLITYDLVAEPGFANATLTKVNENLGILNENVEIFKIPSNVKIEEDEVEYEIQTPSKENKKVIIDKYNKIIDSMSENAKNEIIETLLEKVIGYIDEKITPQIQELSENVNQLQTIPEFINKCWGEYNEEINNKIKLIPGICEYLNGLPFEISRLVNDNMDSFKDRMNGKITTLNGIMAQAADYNKITGGVKQNEIDLVALKSKTNENKLNQVIEYLQNEMPKLQEVVKYVDSNSNAMKQMAEHIINSDYQLNDRLYNIDETISELEENVHRNSGVEEYIRTEIPKLNGLCEYVVEMGHKLNKSNGYMDNALVPQLIENFKELFEKIGENFGVENYAKIIKKETDITEQVDQILAIATKKKEKEITNETLKYYVKHLDDKKQKQYALLTESQKQKFIYHINNVQPHTVNELNMIWDKVVDTNSLAEDKRDALIANMPKLIKPLYEQLDPTSQQRLLELSKNYIINEPKDIHDFWLNRTEFQSLLNKQVIESYHPELKTDDFENTLDEEKRLIFKQIQALNS